jgi:hypothetical protein
MGTIPAGPDRSAEGAWRGFVMHWLAALVAFLAATLVFIVLIDPYDSGRFLSIGIAGIADQTQRTENVSLGRSAKFNAAIFSDSHGQLLDPERLTRETGLSFVQLSIPGANPPEQLAMMHWFIRHHAHIGALVLAADTRWCDADPKPWHWFPFWLYGDSNLDYLLNSLNSRSAGAAVRRIKHAFGLVHPSDPRGYDDYERGLPPGYKFAFPTPAPPPPPVFHFSPADLGSRPFPAVDRLAAELASVPADTRIVILFPPQYYSTLPRDAGGAALVAACKARFAQLVAGTPRRGFLDYFVDSPVARDGDNFDDLEHYRAPVARELEAAIAGVLNGTSTASQ